MVLLIGTISVISHAKIICIDQPFALDFGSTDRRTVIALNFVALSTYESGFRQRQNHNALSESPWNIPFLIGIFFVRKFCICPQKPALGNEVESFFYNLCNRCRWFCSACFTITESMISWSLHPCVFLLHPFYSFVIIFCSVRWDWILFVMLVLEYLHFLVLYKSYLVLGILGILTGFL